MQTKNTLKFIVILVAVGFFGSMFVSGVSAQAQLSAPTPLLAQAGAASGSKAGASLSNPIIVDTTMPVLQISPPPSPGSFYYRFFIYRITGSTVASTPFFQEPLPVSQSLSYRVPPNVLSFGNSYAWTAVTCSDSKCTQASTYSAYSYIKVAAKVAPAPVVAPAGPLPIFFATEANGTVLKFDGANWVRISGPAAEPAPVVSPAPAEAPRGFWTAVGKFFNNLWDRIVQFFGGKNTPTTLSNVNLEIVKFGPDANNITATVSQTPNINCGSSCSAQYTTNTQLTVTVSGANPIYGNYSYVFYKSDGQNNGTHGAEIANWVNTDVPASFSSMINCPPGSPTCTFKAPFVNAELWIGPSTCADDEAVGVFNAPSTTSYIQSPTSAFLSATLGPATPSIPSTIKYNAQLAWGKNINQYADYPATGPNSAGIITGNSTLALSGTVSDPSFVFPSSNPATGSFYGGIQLIKTLTPISGSGNPIITPCKLRLRGNNNNPDNPITPTGETTGGSITIVKVTQNSSGNTIQSSQAFSFTSNTVAPAIPAFTLNTASNPSKNFSPRPAGPYTFTEIVPAGWQNVSATCTGTGFNVNTNFTPPSVGFTMYTGGNVTCTFTNKQTVKKATAVIVNPPPPPPPPVLTCNTVQYTSNVYAVTVGNQTYSVQWQPTPAEVNVASASTASLGLAVTGPSSVAGDNDTVSNNQVTLQSSPISFPGSYNAVLTITPSVVQAGAPPRCQLSKTYTVSQPPSTSCTEDLNKFSISNLTKTQTSSTNVNLGAQVNYVGPLTSGMIPGNGYTTDLVYRALTNPTTSTYTMTTGSPTFMPSKTLSGSTTSTAPGLSGQATVTTGTQYYGAIRIGKLNTGLETDYCMKTFDWTFAAVGN